MPLARSTQPARRRQSRRNDTGNLRLTGQVDGPFHDLPFTPRRRCRDIVFLRELHALEIDEQGVLLTHVDTTACSSSTPRKGLGLRSWLCTSSGQGHVALHYLRIARKFRLCRTMSRPPDR